MVKDEAKSMEVSPLYRQHFRRYSSRNMLHPTPTSVTFHRAYMGLWLPVLMADGSARCFPPSAQRGAGSRVGYVRPYRSACFCL
jgi:hypothetical protein